MVDHHVHGCYAAGGDEARFANALNEADPDPLARLSDGYDSQVGFAVRRWCAELLDLPRHVAPATYWARRTELGEVEVSARLTRAAGVSDWLVDTGFGAQTLLGPTQLGDLAGGRGHEVVRLESLAEAVLAEIDDPADYPTAFPARLHQAAAAAVAAKSVLAYRTGFDVDLTRPEDKAVIAAARRVADASASGRPIRLSDPVLIVFGIYCALDLRLPLQLHVGFGDRDLDLRRVNPLYLTDLLRTPAAGRAPIVLLHCYPYEREAGYLAQAFDQVHLDVGLGVNFLGVRSRALVARSLELAPFTRVLYSSDAAGPAELHYLGARLWRNAITAVLGQWVRDGDWSAGDAVRVARLIGRDNASRVYRLPGNEDGRDKDGRDDDG